MKCLSGWTRYHTCPSLFLLWKQQLYLLLTVGVVTPGRTITPLLMCWFLNMGSPRFQADNTVYISVKLLRYPWWTWHAPSGNRTSKPSDPGFTSEYLFRCGWWEVLLSIFIYFALEVNMRFLDQWRLIAMVSTFVPHTSFSPLPGEAMRARWRGGGFLLQKRGTSKFWGELIWVTVCPAVAALFQREGKKPYLNVNKFSLGREEEVSQILILWNVNVEYKWWPGIWFYLPLKCKCMTLGEKFLSVSWDLQLCI